MEETDAPGVDDGAEESTETRTVQQLIDAGYVSFLTGSDGGAIVDPILPDNPEEPEELNWRFDF